MNEKTTKLTIYLAMPWVIFLCFMQVFSDKMFGIITPSIAASFHLTPAEVSLLTTIAALVFGVGGAIYSTLSDVISPRKLFTIGAAAFGIGSILGFVLQFSFPLVIVARVIQVAGAAVIPGCFVVLVRKYVEKEKQATYLGINTAMYQLSAGLGSVFGGYMTQYLSWEGTLLVPVLVLVTIPFFWKYLPNDDHQVAGQHLDIFGIILITLLFGLMLYAISTKNLLYAVGSVAIMVIYGVYASRATHPIIDLSLFKVKRLLSGTAVGALIYSVQLSFFFLFAFLISASYDVEMSIIGLMYIPANFSAFLSGLASGFITKKIGPQRCYYLGCTIIAISLLMFSLLLGGPIIYMWIALSLFGIGYTIIFPGYYSVFSNSLPKASVGRGMAIATLLSRICYAISIAAVGLLISDQTLAFKLLPSLATNSDMYIYSNVCLLLVVVVIASMVLYKATFSGVSLVNEVEEGGTRDE